MGYQDIWIKGRVTETGKRDCAKRYEAIKEILEGIDDPIVLDFGGHTGYFSYRIAEDFNCPVVLITNARQAPEIHRLNGNKNVHLVREKVNGKRLEEIIKEYKVNTVLALSVLHNNGKWEELYDAISKVPHLFCETPGLEEDTTIYHRNHASILAKFKGHKAICKTPCLSRKGAKLRPLFYVYRDCLRKGKYCTFDPETGIKTFRTKEMRDKSFEAQTMAYDLGYAPKPFEKIGELAYRTEVADTSWFREKIRPSVYCHKIFPEMNKALKPIFQKIYGISFADLHQKNLGILHDKVVLVDFSFKDKNKNNFTTK